MSGYIDFLTEMGLGEVINNDFSLEDSDRYYIEEYRDVYEKNFSIMKSQFDDWFIVEMFLFYNTVLMRNDFGEMLKQVENQFGTDTWGTLVQYEWSETGESAVFGLMDNLQVGYFESNLAGVCEKVRSIWINDYGDDEL